ncbi:MAG: putative C-S lyase [Phycisphaeraceae bacterium]|nr:putative C-S lyase [Phycisphaeraceae bacterium]
MTYNFESIVDRTQSCSLKWDLYRDQDIIPMWVADMDFPAPPEVLEVLQHRIDHGVLGYTLPLRALTEALIDRLQNQYGWAVEPNWIVWLPGLVVGLNLACRAVGASEDEVLVMTPVYPPFLSAPVLSGRQLRTMPLVQDQGRYVVDEAAFRDAITDRTRLLIMCNPHNPVGRAFGKEELKQIARICLEKDVVICSDEIHCDLILDDIPHTPMATLGPDVAAKTMTLMSPSKTFNLPGLNCAFAIIPDRTIRRRFEGVKNGIVPNVNTFGYEAAMAAYTRAEPWHLALLDELRSNRDLVEQAIAQSPGLSMNHVEATYLAWIDARELRQKDPKAFFEKAGVGVSNGADFDGSGFIRLNFGCPEATLKQGLDRMQKAVQS